jgi:hypothetical protein
MLLQLLFFLFLYLPAESCNEYAGHLTEGLLGFRPVRTPNAINVGLPVLLGDLKPGTDWDKKETAALVLVRASSAALALVLETFAAGAAGCSGALPTPVRVSLLLAPALRNVALGCSTASRRGGIVVSDRSNT